MGKFLLFLFAIVFFGCGGSSTSNEEYQTNNSLDIKEVNIEIQIGEHFSYYTREKDIKIKSAPKGLSIFPNGEITWTPTDNQRGNYTVYLYKDNRLIQKLNINVTGEDIEYDGYFVDFSAKSDGDGSPEKPFNSVSSACEEIKNNNYQKRFVYIRGGVYKNKNFGKSLDNRYVEFIKCYGKKDKQIVLRPWGNEKVKILSDGRAAFRIGKKSRYFVIEGIELEGVSQKINFEEALNYWWNDRNYYKGGGIVIGKDCEYITIRENVIHDFPGACISSHYNDGIVYQNNIIYNCAWWSIAGTGGAVIVDSKEKIENKIVGNLFFGIESRIFSRVFQKGFSYFVIDEGKAALFQQNNPNSSKEKYYYLENNFFAYNGKGPVANKASNVYMRNNSLYYSKALRVGGTASNITIEKNAISTEEGEPWVSISRNISGLIDVRENFYREGAMEKYPKSPYVVLENNIPLRKIFTDPYSFKPVTEIKNAGAGASLKDWNILKKMIDKYSIKIKPTGWDYSEDKMIYMTKRIIEDAKSLGDNVIIDCSFLNTDKKVIIKNLPEDFVNEKNIPSSDFELRLKYPYDGEKCDIK